MGGPKKPTLKQLEKKTLRQKQGQVDRPVKGREKSVGGVIPPSMEEVESFIKTQPYITPYTLSEKFGVRISIAKSLLTSLADAKRLRLVQGDSRLRIYAPVEALKEAVKEEKRPVKARRRKKKK